MVGRELARRPASAVMDCHAWRRMVFTGLVAAAVEVSMAGLGNNVPADRARSVRRAGRPGTDRWALSAMSQSDAGPAKMAARPAAAPVWLLPQRCCRCLASQMVGQSRTARCHLISVQRCQRSDNALCRASRLEVCTRVPGLLVPLHSGSARIPTVYVDADRCGSLD